MNFFRHVLNEARDMHFFQGVIHVIPIDWSLSRDGIFRKFCVCWNNVKIRNLSRVVIVNVRLVNERD